MSGDVAAAPDPRAIVDEQAENPNLWRIFDEHVPVTLHEKLLQAELRRLHAAVEETNLRPVVVQAIADLDAEHYLSYDNGPRRGCIICWPKDGSWPCASRLVADDLRAVIEDTP